MRSSRWGVWLSFLAVGAAGVRSQTPSTPPIFADHSLIKLRIEAPLQALFVIRKGVQQTQGSVSYSENGRDVVLPAVVSIRGNTSRDPKECSFPKLKLRFTPGAALDASIFRGAGEIKLGTHCGERPDTELTPKGRVANAKAAHREAFVYQLLETLEVPSLRARPAEITYVDEGRTTVRQAMLLEDTDDAVKRLGADREIDKTQFTTARDMIAPVDGTKLAFAQALIGNFDWCVKWTADDTYRCDARQILWNVAALGRGQTAAAQFTTSVVPLGFDFDIAGMVTLRHGWFPRVFDESFAASRSHPEIEVVAQLQRTRSLFSRADLDNARRHFSARKAAAYRAFETAPLDAAGRTVIKAYMDAFFANIDNDAAFYRPVVTAPSVQVYLDEGRTQQVCGVAVPAGTPVEPLPESGGRQGGTMVHARLLDSLWRWSMNRQCDAMRTSPVWIERRAIGSNYPER